MAISLRQPPVTRIVGDRSTASGSDRRCSGHAANIIDPSSVTHCGGSRQRSWRSAAGEHPTLSGHWAVKVNTAAKISTPAGVRFAWI